MSVTDGIGQTPCSFEHYRLNYRDTDNKTNTNKTTPKRI